MTKIQVNYIAKTISIFNWCI